MEAQRHRGRAHGRGAPLAVGFAEGQFNHRGHRGHRGSAARPGCRVKGFLPARGRSVPSVSSVSSVVEFAVHRSPRPGAARPCARPRCFCVSVVDFVSASRSSDPPALPPMISSHKTLHLAAPIALSCLMACGRGDEGQKQDSAATAPAPAKGAADAGGGPFAYVRNEDSDDITVIDTRTDSAVGTIFVGKRPRGITITPDGRRLFVAVSGSPKAPPGADESKLPPPDRAADGVAVIDLATRTLQRTLKSGTDPESFAVTPDGRTLYVSNEDAGTATVLDVESGSVKQTVKVGGEPEGVTMSPDGKFVYVTSEEGSEVSVISTGDNRVVRSFKTEKRPRSSAFLPDGSRAYVTTELGGVVHVVDARAHTVMKTIRLPGTGAKPMGVVVAPDGRRVYVSTGRGRTVAVIDAATDSVIATVEAGDRPWGLALSADGRKLYTANGPSNDVSVIATDSLRVIKKIKAGRVPWGVVVGR